MNIIAISRFTTHFGRAGLAEAERKRMLAARKSAMTPPATPPSFPSEEARLRAAREAYRRFETRCFWFMKNDLKVTRDDLPFIIEGLKLHGGHEGWKLAQALCR